MIGKILLHTGCVENGYFAVAVDVGGFFARFGELFKVCKCALNAIMQADTLIIAGTSLTVYPAAGFIRYFRGDTVVLINRDKTPFDGEADLVYHDKVGELLGKCVVNK